MAKKIFLLLGHPDASGFCGEIADTYERAAREAGFDLVRMNIGDMRFDPDLRFGYRKRMELEPDLVRFQQLVHASDHFVIVHPIWWLGMPARLKALFDRAWLPGSAFRYIRTKAGNRTILWHRLLKGKTARILVTAGMPGWFVNVFYLPGNVNSQLRWGILWFAGFSVRTSWFGPAEDIPQWRKERWLAQVRKIASYGG